eukprot:CAMPEP_0172661970 /NCGR_PEP_ID=MMETSP1074-20121228/5061_1 /TAXON_ID=2916 /ORGANISM="Ceratium fusus, Strain PA161109" /LENGTH=58 /DNA_ID=CAMNT_0013477819 /DNA_START=1155 /DNA_END=1328 /DNA_ORIENTATION=+
MPQWLPPRLHGCAAALYGLGNQRNTQAAAASDTRGKVLYAASRTDHAGDPAPMAKTHR